MAQLTAEQLEKLKQLNELVKQYPQDRRDKFFKKAANNGLKTNDADTASVLNAVFILAVDEKRKLADYIEHYVLEIPNNKTPQEVCLDYLDYVLNEVGIPYSDKFVKTQNSTLALDCLHFMEEYHIALAEEKKRANDPDYAARKQQEELWEREKAQLRENVKKVDAFFDGINVDSLYEKDLPFKNDMKLLTSREPLQLSEEDLTKCEQVYDEIFGKEDIKDLIQVYKFYAFIPFETDTQKNRRVALCDIDGKQLSEEEKAKEIRKGKAEILRAMFDPARKLQYRTAEDKRDRELKYGDVAYHQNQVDNAHININAVKTPEWLHALTEEKRKYNESLKATVEQVLSNPAPEMFSYTYEGVNNDNKLIDINKITENDYETMKKAAETFDKMFKPLSDKQKEIGISKDLVWSFSYKGNPIEKHIAHEGHIMRGWEIEVMAKAIALNAMANDGKNVKFKPYDYSGNLPGFAPVRRPKSEATMEPKLFTGKTFSEQEIAEIKTKLKEGYDKQRTLQDKLNYLVNAQKYAYSARLLTQRLDSESDYAYKEAEKKFSYIQSPDEAKKLHDALAEGIEGLVKTLAEETRGSKEVYACQSYLDVLAGIEYGRRREELEKSDLYTGDPKRKEKLDYLCNYELANEGVLRSSALNDIRIMYAGFVARGRENAPDRSQTIFKDTTALKRMTIKEFEKSLNLNNANSRISQALSNTPGKYNENENAYEALKRLYKHQRNTNNVSDNALLEEYFHSLYINKTSIAASDHAKQMLIESLSPEERKYYDEGQRITNSQYLSELRYEDFSDEIEAFSLRKDAPNNLNDRLTEGENNLKDTRTLNAENDPVLNPLFAKPAPGADPYDKFIMEHTGHNVLMSNALLEDTYAKTMVAVQMKNNHEPFSEQTIDAKAATFKTTSMRNVTNDDMVRALATPATAESKALQIGNPVEEIHREEEQVFVNENEINTNENNNEIHIEEDYPEFVLPEDQNQPAVQYPNHSFDKPDMDRLKAKCKAGFEAQKTLIDKINYNIEMNRYEANASTVTTRLNKADAEGGDFYNSFTNQEKGQLVIKNTNNARALSDNLNGIKTSVSDSVNSENKGSKEFYATLSLLNANNFIEIGKRREQLENSNLFLNDPDRKIKLDYICQNETGNSAVDFEKGVTELKSDAERKASPGNGFGAKTDDSPMFKDTASLKKMRMKDFLAAAGATEGEKKRFFDLYNKKGSAFSEEENAYTALMRIYKAQNDYINSKDKSEAAVERGMLLFAKKEFYLMNTGSAMTQAEGMLYETLSEEDKRLFEAGKRLAGQDLLKDQEKLSAEDKKALQKIAFAGKAGKINRGLTEGEKNVTNAKAFNLENDPRFKVLYEQPVKGRKANPYDIYIQLNTGMNVFRKEDSLPDVYAKVIAAMNLKEKKVGFNLRKITDEARNVKNSPAFSEMTNDMMAKALATPRTAAISRTQLLTGVVPKEQPVVEDIILHTEPNIILGNGPEQNIIPNIGEERKPEENIIPPSGPVQNIIPPTGPEQNIIPNNGPEQNIIPNIEGERRPNPTVIVNNELEINTDQDNTNLLSGEEPKEEKQVYDDDLALYTTMKTQHAELSAKAVGDYLVARKRLERDVYRETDQTRKEELQKQLDKLIQVNEPKQESLYATEALIIALDEFHQKHKENLRTDKNLKRMVQDIISGHNPEEFNKRVNTLTAGVKAVRKKLRLRDDVMIPEELKDYVKRPDALAGPRLAAAQSRLLDAGKADLFKAEFEAGAKQSAMAAFKKEIGMPGIPEADNIRARYLSVHKDWDKINRWLIASNMATRRTTTASNVFLLYLMGREKDAFTFEQAYHFAPREVTRKEDDPLYQQEKNEVDEHNRKYDAEIQNFYKFLQDYPLLHKLNFEQLDNNGDPRTTELTEVEKKIAVRKWNNLLTKAMKNLEEYTFPNIDYSNTDQLYASLGEIQFLSDFAQDFSQEGQKINGAQPAILEQEQGGMEAASKNLSVLPKIQSFCSSYLKVLNPEVPGENVSFTKTIKNLAGDRAAFAYTANSQFSGKKIKDLAKGSLADLIETLALQVVGTNIRSTTIFVDEAKEYLTEGKNAEIFNRVIRDSFETIRIETFNDCQRSAAQDALIHGINPHLDAIKASLKSVYGENIPKTPQEIVDSLNTPDGAATLSAIATFKDRLLTSGYQEDFTKAIPVANKMNLVKVDGRTPGEIWGQKYAGLGLDENTLERALWAEVINAVVYGNQRITFDRYYVDTDMTMKKVGEEPIIESPERITQTQNFLNAVHKVTLEADNLIKLAESVERREHNIYEDRLDNMISKAKKLKDASINDNFPTLEQAVSEYKDAVKQFYDMQRNIGKTSESAAHFDNLESRAYGALDTLMDECRKYSQGLLLVPSEYEGNAGKRRGDFSKMAVVLTYFMKARQGKEFAFEPDNVPYENEWAWLNNALRAGDRISDEQLAQFDQASGIGDTNAILTAYESKAVEMLGKQDYKNAITANTLFSDRRGTLQSVFATWLISTYKVDIPTVAKVIEGEKVEGFNHELDDLHAEFIQFITDHPQKVKPEDNRETQRKNIKIWVKMFADTADAIKNYTLPDIDFSDAQDIKKHVKELNLLRNLGVDGVQELGKCLTSGGIDRTNHVGEKTGDEQLDAVDAGTLRQTQDLYMGVQKIVTEALFQGYYEQNVSDMAGKIAKKAAHRYMAGKMFNPYRGKTFGDFYNEQGIKYQNTDSLFQTLDPQIMDEDPNTNEVEKRGLTCNKAFGYLIGKNKKAYEDAISPIIAEYDEQTRTSQNIEDRGRAVKLRQELLDEFIRTEFSALPKNATAEEMIRFLDKDTGKEGEKVRDRVTQKLNRTLFSGNSNTLIDHLGEPRYDLFLINGRKPSEIFAEKYPDHIEIGDQQQVDISEEIREKLIFAEVFKAMADPDAKIEVRNFTTTGLGTIKENKPSVLLLPRKEMDKVQLDYEAFRAERDNLISELKDIKKGLQKTMSNPEANFNGDNNKEGTPLYQEMTRQLQVSIDILEAESRNQSRGTKRAIRNALEEMERAAANYDRNRRGTFFEGGAYQDKGKKRLVYSDRLKQGWVKRYLQSRDYLKSDLIVSADKNNNKLSFVNNAESMADMADELNKLKTTYGLQGSAVHAKNEVVRNEIRAKWDEYSTKIADYKAGKTETKEETLAKAYLLGFFERRMEIIRPDVNPVEWQYDDIRTMEHYDERINELVKNPVFLELMRKSPDLCIDSWHKFEKQAQESKAQYEQKLNEALTEYTTYEKYIANLPNNEANAGKTLAGEIRALRTNPDADLVLGTYYDNLSTLVLYQLLSRDTDFANSMRQQIAADGDDGFVNMATKAAQYLERKHYLDERNVTSTLNKLQNGRLADEVYKDLQSRDKRERETETREWSRVQDERVDAFAFMANEKAELTEAQWNLFAERMDLDFNKASYDKYIACSTRLESEPLTVTENVFVEGENGAEGRMEERPIQGDTRDFESFNPQRPTSRQSGYIIWTMATKNLSFPEAYRLCSIMPPEAGEAELRNADQNRADFIKFLRENNVKANADNPEKATEIFRKWADVYSKATEKIKEYKFPKVDYRDPEKFKAAFPEIRSLMQVALDCDQDYDYLFNIRKPVNGLSVAAEAMGGKDNYVDKKNLWWGLVSLTAPLYQGCPDSSAKSSYVGNDVGELVGFAKGIAASRAVYLKDFQRVAGKSVKEAVDFIGDEVFYRNFVAQKYKSEAKENAYNKESITAESTMKYLLGKDRDKYETALQPFIDGMKRDAIEGNVDIQRQRAAKLLVHFTIDDNIREKLDNLQDNVEDIDEFMNSVVFEDASRPNNSLTGRAWLEKFFEQTLGQDEEMIARMNGIPTIDLILIDGRAPSEIYADKYADINDSVKKEELIRLEVAKALLNRESRIEKRIFTFKAGKLVETATSPIVLNPEDMQKTLNAVHAYEAGRDELLSILRDFKVRYRDTQKDTDANFRAEAGSEGNTNYVAAMHKLQGMIDLLKSDEKTDVNPQVIYNDFDELLRLVNTHAAQGSDKRTRISKEFKQAIPVLKKGFEYLRNNLGSGVVLGEGQTFKDTPAYSIVKRAELIENKLGYEKLPDRIYKQQAAQRMIHAEADHILEMPLPAGPQTQEAYKSAQTYVTINLLSKTNSAKGTFEDFRRSMVCEKRLEELASNKAFTHFMKEEPWNALLFWEGKEKRCDSLKETCRDFLETVHLGKISSYLVSSVTGKEIKVNSALDTAITDGDEYDEKEAFYKDCADEVREIIKGVAGQRGKRKLYNILADYCLKETLAGDDAAANDLRMIVASRDDLHGLFVEKHEEILKNLGVFEEDDDLEFMLEALDDGSFLKRKVKPAFAKTLKTMKDSGELDRIIKDPNARKKNNENSIDLLDINGDISTSTNEKRRDSVFVSDDEKMNNSILNDQEDNKSVSSDINPLDISYDSVYENEIMKHVGENGIDPNYNPPKKQKNRNDEEDPKEEIKLDFDSDKASDNGSEGGFDDDFKDEKANDIFIREFDGKKISADNEYDQQAFEDNLAILKISDFVNVSIEDESKHKVKPRRSIRKNVPKNKKGTVKDEKGQGLSLMGKAYAKMKALINEESVYDKNHKLKMPSGKFAKSFAEARKNAAVEIENVGGSVMQSSTRNTGKVGRIAGIDEERMKTVIRAFILKDMNEHKATSWDDFETSKNRLFANSDSRLALFRMLKFYNGKEFKKVLQVNTAQGALDLFNTGKQLKGETTAPETGAADNSYYNKGEAEMLKMEGKNITIKDNRINIVPDANEINIIPDNKINIINKNDKINIIPDNKINIIPDNKINIINKNDIKNDNRINLINNGENKINIGPPKDEKLTGQEKKAHDTYKSLISKLEKMEGGYKTLEGVENEEKFKVITEAAIFQDVIKQNKELYQGLFANQTFKPIDYYESVKNTPKLKRAVQSLMQDVESKDIARLIDNGQFETYMKDHYGAEMFKEFRAKLMKKGAPENEAGGPKKTGPKPGAGPKPEGTNPGPKPGAGPKP